MLDLDGTIKRPQGLDPAEWYPIPDFPAYKINRQGQVWSFYKQLCWEKGGWQIVDEPQTMLKCCRRGKHHWGYNLRNRGIAKSCYAHLLVLRVFVGPRPKGYRGVFKDRNTRNYRLSNLEYVPVLEAVRLSWAAGDFDGAIIGGYNKKLSDETVLEIRRLYTETDLTCQQIVNRLGLAVRKESISNIATGYNYKRVGGVAPHRAPDKFCNEQIVAIRERASSGTITQRKLGEEYGVTQSMISAIVLGQCYKAAGGPVKRTKERPG